VQNAMNAGKQQRRGRASLFTRLDTFKDRFDKMLMLKYQF